MAKIYLNGKIVDDKKATISVFDRGLQYGDGVFETILYRNRKVFFLSEHLKRLKNGLRSLSIKPPSGKSIRLGIKRLISANKLGNKTARIKIIVTRGVDRGSYLPLRDIQPTTIITSSYLDERTLGAMRENGISAVFVPFTPHRTLGGIKSLNYLPSVTAKILASRLKSYEAIFTTPEGFVLEGSSSNIFIVKNGTLVTPALKTKDSATYHSILDGITRAAVLKLAKRLGLKCKERKLTKAEVFTSDEAFITNSVALVLPLVKMHGRGIGNCKPGKTTRLLLRAITGKE